ncbi:MAG: penicillin acylase family protein [Blastocatellia bacterium]|nr:penicillin acylase family protein [Blastocatellia bacterium]MCX7753005.1 penicillin acylase family protein [Blastocatellia bacterium]MDW8256942.1 penicillin acylase family protein [Acidobacteriota bacterium]
MNLRRTFTLVAILALLLPSLGIRGGRSAGQAAPILIRGLRDEVRVIRDRFGVPHIFARNDHDVYFMMGYVQAQDRFFQMDFLRRAASGTLAELLGRGPNDSVLAQDIQLRVLGLRRAAEASYSVLSAEAQAVLQAFASGVNAFLRDNPLPPEYTGLELTKAAIPEWTPVDSVVVGKLLAFQLSFGLDDIDFTLRLAAYQQAGQAFRFDGTKLFFEDIFRSAPFDPSISIPEALQASSAQRTVGRSIKSDWSQQIGDITRWVSPETIRAAREYLEEIANLPFLQNALDRTGAPLGSNWWIVSGSKTDTGFPMLANDPHLGLGVPSIFYEMHLVVEGSNPMNVMGVCFAGTPVVVLGMNERIAWGATTNPMDVTDVYEERAILDISTQLPIATIFRDQRRRIVAIPQVFRANRPGNGTADDLETIAPGTLPSGVSVPSAALVIPERNNAPIVRVVKTDLTDFRVLSVQYTGFGPTRELETFLIWHRARNLDDFKRGLQYFDFGSQNWAYMDVDGNIAYFTSGELPLREDLQEGRVDGLPPFFIRNGAGAIFRPDGSIEQIVKNDWVPLQTRQPGQAVPFEILPFEEMPQIVNPSRGFIINANNDPIGTTLDNNPLNQLRRGGRGILYLSPGYSIGPRMGRIVRLIQRELDPARGGDGRISLEDMKRFQANVQMLDAEVFVPYIRQAFANARDSAAPAPLAALARDLRVAEAVDRLSRWDFSTPTGIPEGYDASDVDGIRQPPTPEEIAASVAATIYSVWRARIIANTIDATLARVGLREYRPGGSLAVVALRNLLDNFPQNRGRGASGLNFFDAPGVDLSPEAERDLLILRSLQEALDRLASDEFRAAFNNSTNLEDYRWGKLHRIVFTHTLGDPFNIPPAGGFTHLAPALRGVAVDGGFEVVDASGHDARAEGLNSFMFGGGAARRFLGEARPDGIRALQIIPGGQSGILGSPLYASQLSLWLTNSYHALWFTREEVERNKVSEQIFRPGS